MSALTLKRKKEISEDETVLFTLEKLKREIAQKQQSLDFATDDMLIDSCIYELKALSVKYGYYIRLCKEKGLIAHVF
ncbi:hypothetical protein FACS189490_09810 [Clostridia bacterium]|nr:hypothetical protein FACS189490_09810 [Clostridia bacterium]